MAGRYAFIHALYQQVLYARVSIGDRVGLHLRTGERLERGYGQRASEIAGELATHFEHGRDFERAARYRSQAGEHALRQHAYREAADHAARALTTLRALPESPERAQQELALQVLLGAALSPTQGYATPEVARTYARARELCEQVGDTAQLFSVLLGLGRFYVVRAEFQTARDIAAQLLTMAEATRDTAPLLAAHNVLGVVSYYAGDFEAALAHLERGIALYDPEVHGPNRSSAFRLGQDPGVSCTTHSALSLWMLGYPARAAARMQEAFALARSLDHPFSVAYACHFAAGLHQWRRDRQAVQDVETEALALDTEHGFGLFLTAGAIQRGWLLAEAGRQEEGLAQMRDGLARHRDIGAEVLAPAFLAMVAEVHEKLGRLAESLSIVSEALVAGQRSGQHYWEGELHRLRGALTLRAGGSPDDAESCFLQAMAVARSQKARSLELRAATSLSRLWAGRGKVREAHALLSGVYNWFTEGFDTADLIDAKSLLEELGSRAGGSRARQARRSNPAAPGRGEPSAMRRGRPGELPAVRLEMENEWAWCGPRRLDLTPRAFAVLRHLVERAGRLVTKDELLTTLWRDAIVSDAALASCIRDLRRALRETSEAPRYIETVHRRGFRFIGPIASATTAVSAVRARVPGSGADPQPAAGPVAGHGTTALVGRDAELRRLRERLEQALKGSGSWCS